MGFRFSEICFICTECARSSQTFPYCGEVPIHQSVRRRRICNGQAPAACTLCPGAGHSASAPVCLDRSSPLLCQFSVYCVYRYHSSFIVNIGNKCPHPGHPVPFDGPSNMWSPSTYAPFAPCPYPSALFRLLIAKSHEDICHALLKAPTFTGDTLRAALAQVVDTVTERHGQMMDKVRTLAALVDAPAHSQTPTPVPPGSPERTPRLLVEDLSRSPSPLPSPFQASDTSSVRTGRSQSMPYGYAGHNIMNRAPGGRPGSPAPSPSTSTCSDGQYHVLQQGVRLLKEQLKGLQDEKQTLVRQMHRQRDLFEAELVNAIQYVQVWFWIHHQKLPFVGHAQKAQGGPGSMQGARRAGEGMTGAFAICLQRTVPPKQ